MSSLEKDQSPLPRHRSPHPNDYLQASLSPPVLGRLRSFRLANKQLFMKHAKHCHQWLRFAIPLKTKLGQISSDSVRVQGRPSKRPSSGHLYPVSSVQERNRKVRII